jgi:uncharacterized membrane protein YGL010W
MQARLTEYSGSHRSPKNEACHYVGIPLIIVGAASMLGAVPLVSVASFSVSLAELVTAAIVVFYVVSARWLGVVTSLIFIALLTAGRLLPAWAGLLVFLCGWGAQFFGHAVYEKTSPAFLKNLVHLLVGPAWLVERALSRLP